MIELSCEGWTSGPVTVADGFWERWRGIKRVSRAAGLVIATRSVHTFGLDETIGVVSLAPDRTVLSANWVKPRQIVKVRGAAEYLELRRGRSLPPLGVQLRARPIVAR